MSYRWPVSRSTVLIWTVPLHGGPVVPQSAERLLDDAERRRYQALPPTAGRAEYLTAHVATRLILARRLGVSPAAIRWRRGRNGKPELVGLPDAPQVSISHSGGWAMVALADRPVGVDVERVQDRWGHRPPTGLFASAEVAAVAAAGSPPARAELFVRLWTRKEACVKAAGGTMLPHGIGVPTLGGEALVVRDGPARWRVRTVPAAAGYHASVALTGAADFTVSVQQWPATTPGPRSAQ